MASLSTNSQQNTQRAPQGPLRIVVVEDNRDDVLILTALLRAEGHHTKACYKGSEALDCIKEFDADVVVLDIGLPGGTSGWEVARQIRAHIPGMRPMIIGVTGQYTKGADKILSEMNGFDYYLLKPADPKVLFALLAQARHPR